jgi:hypothetical protein
MRFQSRGKWDHLTTLTPGALAESLADLFGLGGWGGAVGLGLSVAALALVAFGVWAAVGVRVAVAPVRRHLAPAGLAWAFVGLGLLAAAGFAVAYPRLIEPTARQVLGDYGYDAAVVDEEIALLRQTGLLAAGCVALAGGIVFVWRRVEGRMLAADLKQGTPEAPTAPAGEGDAGVLLTIFLLVPVVVIALGSLTGVPFHQTRNLIVMLPAICLAGGFALDRLARTPARAVAAAVVLAGAVFAAAQYHAVGRVVGATGPSLGLDTINWRQVRGWLATGVPAGTVLVLADAPPTDPALYYLADLRPVRVPTAAAPPALPPRFVFIHLPRDRFSERAKERLTEARGRLARVAQGERWEIYVPPE